MEYNSGFKGLIHKLYKFTSKPQTSGMWCHVLWQACNSNPQWAFLRLSTRKKSKYGHSRLLWNGAIS